MPIFTSPGTKSSFGTAPDSDINALPQDTAIVVAQLAMKLNALGLASQYHHYVNGPLVETFFFHLQASVPLAKVLSRTEDMAFATARESAVIIREGGYIGIQLAKKERETVNFSNCLFRLAPQLMDMRLPILLGQTYTGEYRAIDLADEPHALVAGSTGSGKSMFLLSSICTLAVTKRPEDLKLIIVDSKQVDLTIVEGLPHVHQVCRNALDLHNALDYLLNEMRRRNALLAGVARNIDEYNSSRIISEMGGGRLPRIVLIIDEFADIIEEDFSLAKAKQEPFKSFTRIAERLRSLAQLSRASGINIIAATQRPSVQITSGDLKVNLPCRIAFKLTTSHDSKTVLKEIGAENLLGKGDMLVQPVSSPIFRAHAPHIDMPFLHAILKDVDSIRDMMYNMSTGGCTPCLNSGS